MWPNLRFLEVGIYKNNTCLVYVKLTLIWTKITVADIKNVTLHFFAKSNFFIFLLFFIEIFNVLGINIVVFNF